VSAAFLCLRFRFVLYWRKTVGAKAEHRTLVKLLHFAINFTRNFFIQNLHAQLFILEVWLSLNAFGARKLAQKSALKMLVKLTPG
jgi:hypothetical protein